MSAVKTWWRSLWPDERVAAVGWMAAIIWLSAVAWPVLLLVAVVLALAAAGRAARRSVS